MSTVLPLFAPPKNRNQRRTQVRLQRPAPGVDGKPGRVNAAGACGTSPGGTQATAIGAVVGAALPLDQALMLELLGTPPVAFQRAYVDITGSVTAALWLSHAMARLAADIGGPGTYGLDMTSADCSAHTGMTRREQDTARKQLRAAGLIGEERRGKHLHYLIRVDAIAERLMGLAQSRWSLPPAAEPQTLENDSRVNMPAQPQTAAVDACGIRA